MAWLLIDNSNSRTKFRLGDAGGLLEWRAVLPTDALDEGLLEELTSGLGFEAVVFCSVVPEKGVLLGGFFGKSVAVHSLEAVSYPEMLVECRNPGADRLANAIALREKHGFPGVAIDFGTAVTFNVVSAEGNFMGGVIAPGMAAMTGYLASRTAQLPEVIAEEPERAIGRDTRGAMLSGAVYGQRGMVKEILRKIREEMGGDLRVVATGGGAEFLAAGLPEVEVVDMDLTMEGLRLVGARIFS